MSRRVAALVLAGLLGLPLRSEAQLLSPGKLARAHTELEGLRNCTSCHELGQRGVSAVRCLNCHEALAVRIEARQGYHSSVGNEACSDCHQDHLGADFDLRRLDENSFDHDETGYALELSHDSVACRDCHSPSRIADAAVKRLKTERGALQRTFLGLSTDCVSCHADDDPHGSQFGSRACTDCHDTGVWEAPPNFDHATTSFPLKGRHQAVGCVECHGSRATAVYHPLEAGTCRSCHEDPHSGAMSGPCSSCHSTAGWDDLSSGSVERFFDHATTAFPLAGAHATIDCGACHRRGSPPATQLIRMTYVAGTASSAYPRPVFTTCRSCHVDQHATAPGEVRWSDCESCHSAVGWTPSPYDVVRHAQSDFPLTGSHAVTPCISCHQAGDRGQTAFTLAVPGRTCVECHEAEDPHGELYKQLACDVCHDTEAFEPVSFDHALVEGGAADQTCQSCHAADDPHGGQFEGHDCSDCHGTDVFAIETFDHDTTRYPLDGAHASAACAACHVPDPSNPSVVRYRPLGRDCVDCHTGGA